MRTRCLLAVWVSGVLSLGCGVAGAEPVELENEAAAELSDATLPPVAGESEICASLLPGPLGPPTGTLTTFDPDESVSVYVDGAGNLLFDFRNIATEAFRLELRRKDGSLVANVVGAPRPQLVIEQDEGFHLLGRRSENDPVALYVLTPTGTLIPKPQTFTGSVDAVPRGGNGTLISHSLKISATRWRVEAFVLDGDGDVSAGPIFIANGTGTVPPRATIGSTAPNSALVLFDSSAGQDRTRWSARWFNPSGGFAVGLPFEVAVNLPAFTSLWLIPLLNGELGVRTGRAAWLGRFRPFQKEMLLAPPWLAARPEYEVVPIRTGRGFGLFLSSGELGCTNFLLVHTPEGVACGEVVVPPPPPPCRSSGIWITRTGTLLQFAPFYSEPGGQIRWWTDLLD